MDQTTFFLDASQELHRILTKASSLSTLKLAKRYLNKMSMMTDFMCLTKGC
jgi:hypothetical protein